MSTLSVQQNGFNGSFAMIGPIQTLSGMIDGQTAGPFYATIYKQSFIRAVHRCREYAMIKCRPKHSSHIRFNNNVKWLSSRCNHRHEISAIQISWYNLMISDIQNVNSVANPIDSQGLWILYWRCLKIDIIEKIKKLSETLFLFYATFAVLTMVTASCSAARLVFLLKLLLNAVVVSFCMLLFGVVIQYKNIMSDKMRTSKTSILFFETGMRPCTSLSICFNGNKKRKSLSEAIKSNGSSFDTQVSFFSGPFE